VERSEAIAVGVMGEYGGAGGSATVFVVEAFCTGRRGEVAVGGFIWRFGRVDCGRLEVGFIVVVVRELNRLDLVVVWNLDRMKKVGGRTGATEGNSRRTLANNFTHLHSNPSKSH